MSSKQKRIAILISGRGSNMSALIEASKEPKCPFEIGLVVSDQPEAAGIGIAEANGIPTQCIERRAFSGKFAHEAAIEEALNAAATEIVALAGYMRLLSPAFVGRWSGRMVNIHPALLPAFPGLETHRRALEAGIRIHGCTVHFVTAEVDSGPIIAQAAVPVLLGDDAASLGARVLVQEHRIYPKALALVCRQEVRMAEGKTIFAADSREENTGASIVAPDFSKSAGSLEDLARFTP